MIAMIAKISATLRIPQASSRNFNLAVVAILAILAVGNFGNRGNYGNFGNACYVDHFSSDPDGF
jgi:hypothetical protein